MTVSDDELKFETHLNTFRSCLGGLPENDRYWHHQAQDMHMICATDGVSDLQVRAVILAQKLDAGSARDNLLYGVARRSKMIMGAMRQLSSLIRPDRREPLPHEDVHEAERALNDIYIHSRGLLDNYAWAIFHLFADDDLRAFRQTDVSLFRRKFQKHPAVVDFGSIALSFAEWEAELKERRDPVAHRIPLTVPPAFLNDADVQKYRGLEEKANAALAHLAERASSREPVEAASLALDELHAQMGRIGSFQPLIVHDPQKGGTPIYPTVAEDVGTLVIIARRLNQRIEERLWQ